MLNIFLDTNVMLDCILDRAPWSEAAQALIDAGKTSPEIRVSVASLSLKDVYFITSKAKTEAIARGFVGYLLETCQVVSVGASTCQLALEGPEPDFEDGLIAAAAQESGADVIVTRDEAAFAHLPVPKVDPILLHTFLFSNPYPNAKETHLGFVRF